MNNHLISIIVPIYNVDKYLSRCLESLIAQTFKEIEIICIVDGSTDKSFEICKEYQKKDPRIIIKYQENQGVASARNTGLSLAQGEFIQFCDPDDYYEPEMCEKMYEAISVSNADLVSTGVNIIYDNVDSYPGDIDYFKVKINGLSEINEMVFKYTDVSLCNKIFKKSIIDKYCISFPHGLVYEDACFFYKYLFISKTIYYVNEYLYNYIRHKESIMSKTFIKSKMALDHVKILNDIKNFLLEMNKWNDDNIKLFLWIVITYLHSTFRHGIKDIYHHAIEIINRLISDISIDCIQKCQNLLKKEKKELLNIKKGNIENYNLIILLKYNSFIMKIKKKFFVIYR